jgi:hypothetical protein
MKPSVPLILVLLAVAYAGALFVRYVPVRIFAGTTEAPRPMQHTQEETYRFARTIVDLFGGLPRDAQVVPSSEMMVRAGSAPQRISDFYRWHHRDLLASSDLIYVRINERADGTMYPIAIFRRWQPVWLTEVMQWNVRRHAQPLPAFAEASSCRGGLSEAALSRVLGSPLTYLPANRIYRESDPRSRPPSLASRPAARVAWPQKTIPTLQTAELYAKETDPVQARAAWVSDGPPGEAFRIVMLDSRFPNTRIIEESRWYWRTFASADIEHICRLSLSKASMPR